MTKKLWEKDYTPWKTEAQFLAWIRGGLRRLWARHPVKNELKRRNRVRLPNEKGREVWQLKCDKCKTYHVQAQVQVDHKKPNHTFTDMAHLGAFARSLLDVDIKDLQLLCKECHGIKTYAERYGVTLTEAKKRKQEIKRRKK